MAKVSLKNVSTHRVGGDRKDQTGLTLDIESREFLVLTGPSGSGKTALLRAIAGLDEVASGEILIGDRRLNDLKPKARDVAMVFPSDALYPEMSARENIALGLKLRKFSQTELDRRVQDSAATFGIEDALEQRAGKLPAAVRQRVSIARAIARQPKLLLFDEPLANLDAGTRVRLRSDIRQLHGRLEATIIYATADASEAIAMGKRMVVIKDGRVEQDGSLQAVYDTPANLFVAGFVGTPPMNFLQGTLKVERDSLIFSEMGEGTVRVRLPLADFPVAGELVGKPVILGVRAEDIEVAKVSKGEKPSEDYHAALVDLVEPLGGGETNLYLQTGAHAIVCRNRMVSGGEPAGRRVRFRFNLAQVHFFDPVSTLRIAEA